MCGIAGILNITGQQNQDVSILQKMVHLQKHRGPDESGLYLDDNIGLRNRALVL